MVPFSFEFSTTFTETELKTAQHAYYVLQTVYGSLVAVCVVCATRHIFLRFQALTNMASQGLNAVSIALSVTAWAFFVVGVVGFARDRDVIENTAWVIFDDAGVEGYFGLRNFLFKDGPEEQENTYFSDSCTADYCSVCKKAGRGTFGLTIIAIILATITVALSVTSLVKFNRGLQIANVFMSFLSAGSSLIGVGLFMSWCWESLKDEFDQNFDLDWGNGSIVSILGMLMMWVVVVFQIAAAVVGGEAPKAPAATSANTPAGAVAVA